MPAHEHNSFGDLVRRLRRDARHRIDLRRSGPWAQGLATDPGEGPAAAWTTVDATIRPLGTDRYRRLGWAPGEPHLVRDDLGVVPSADRAAVRRSLLYVAQHTDVHLCDAQSPARVEGGEAFGWVNPGSDSGHRPQETCTTQVLDQLVRATNAVAVSPVSGAPMAWCIQTGDNTDNRTTAEVRWWLDVLGGRPVTPNTGAEGRYEGLQRSGWRTVWHPDRPGWDRRQQQGYPHLPGFLDASVAPFRPEGLRVPWLAVFGNHDQIFTGTFGPPTGRNLRIDLLEPMLAGSSRKPASAVGLIRAIAHASRAGADTDRWERASRGPGVHTVTAAPMPADRSRSTSTSPSCWPTGPTARGPARPGTASGRSTWSSTVRGGPGPRASTSR